MQVRDQSTKTGWISELAPYWRELLFWLLLLPAIGALESTRPRRQVAGLIETCAFLLVAISSTGKLKGLGLEFVSWNRIGPGVAAVCVMADLFAGCVIVGVAGLFDEPLGVENGWSKAALAVSLGPVLEEVIFRGYLFTAALLLIGRLSPSRSPGVSVIGTAVLFSIAHLATPGITALQLGCIGLTGSLYGYLRFRFRSTAAAALAHGMYNLALYLSYWAGVSKA
jgi:membrane protease YdiL (CAAX protease family)